MKKILLSLTLGLSLLCGGAVMAQTAAPAPAASEAKAAESAAPAASATAAAPAAAAPAAPASAPVLVPNKQGMNGAVEAGVGEIAIFTAASEAFCRKNTN